MHLGREIGREIARAHLEEEQLAHLVRGREALALALALEP